MGGFCIPGIHRHVRWPVGGLEPTDIREDRGVRAQLSDFPEEILGIRGGMYLAD